MAANRQFLDGSMPGMGAMPLANEVMPAYVNDYSYVSSTPLTGSYDPAYVNDSSYVSPTPVMSYDLDPLGYPVSRCDLNRASSVVA
jgi:hypothetical protein